MANRKDRKYFQVMGYWLNESAILNPDQAIAAVTDLADEGYDLIRVFLRNTNFTHRSPEVVKIIGDMTRHAHKRGLKLAMDCEPHYFSSPIVGDMGREYPDATGQRLVRGQGYIVNGNFKIYAPHPKVNAVLPSFAGVEAAFVKDDENVIRLDNFVYNHRHILRPYDDGLTREAVEYTTGLPFQNIPKYYIISGQLPEKYSGELILYVAFDDIGLPDFWADGFRHYYESLLEYYRNIPLDGVGWDEPAVNGNWNAYCYGRSFAAAFKRINNYDLRDRLYLLDEPYVSAEASKVRLDYYRTLNEGLFQAQRNMITKARELFGEDIITGTHHTWTGEGGIEDYRAGAVDYFRLNQNMDAGYTDNCMWDDGSVCYTCVLAGSLGRLTPSGAAECNTWHWDPTNSVIDYYSRFMTLLRMNWFNIWYGVDSEDRTYPSNYTWAKCNESMRRNREYLKALGDVRPVVDVAIWHGWEGIMALNRADYTAASKAFQLNTSETLVHRNIAFDFIDSELLAKTVIKEDRLCTNLESYSILIMPYACVLPKAIWETCKKFAHIGGTVIFIGPPLAQTIEGDDLTDEFSRMLGIKEFSLGKYITWVDSICTLPRSRPATLDISFPLEPDGGEAIISTEGNTHGIISPNGGLMYMSDLDPRGRLADIVETRTNSSVECFSDTILWRLYSAGDAMKLVLISKKDRQMRGIIRIGNNELEVKNGKIALVHIFEGKPEIVLTDGIIETI